MFTLFKTFSWTALVSVLGYAFVDSPEVFYHLINSNEHQTQMDRYKAAFDDMNDRDQILMQTLHLKNQVYNAFIQHEISIYEAASCFQTVIFSRNGIKEIIPHNHENYSPNIRACLGFLLWLKDSEFKGADFEIVINDFRNIVNIAKTEGYEIMLPRPPAKLLAEYLY